MMSNKKTRGRPRRSPVSVESMRAAALESIRSTQHRHKAINTTDLGELVDEVDSVTQYKRYSPKQIKELREKVQAVYDDYLQRLEIEEEQEQAELKRNLPQLAMSTGSQTKGRPITEAEWNEMHGLRADGSKKRGPAPKKKKLVWDLEPGKGGTASEKVESLDIDALEKAHEQAMIEQEIQRQLEIPQPYVGKRLRKAYLNTRSSVDQSKFYY